MITRGGAPYKSIKIQFHFHSICIVLSIFVIPQMWSKTYDLNTLSINLGICFNNFTAFSGMRSSLGWDRVKPFYLYDGTF